MKIAQIIEEFEENLNKVKESSHPEPTAMTLATVSSDGRPSSRVVLLKEFSEKGFVFYTNYESRKAKHLAANPYAALTFAWYELKKQVRVEGSVTRTTEEDSDAYFASRPRKSQIGAWASQQSAEMKNPDALEKLVAEYTAKFKGDEIPRPPFWGGYIVEPTFIEFWQAGEFRLHDRRVFEKGPGADWSVKKVYP